MGTVFKIMERKEAFTAKSSKRRKRRIELERWHQEQGLRSFRDEQGDEEKEQKEGRRRRLN